MYTYLGTAVTAKKNKCMQGLFQLLIAHMFSRISSGTLDAQISCFAQVSKCRLTVSILELSILRIILQVAGIYTVLFHQTKIGKNELILTKESIVHSIPPPAFIQERPENFSMLAKRRDLHFLNFQWEIEQKGGVGGFFSGEEGRGFSVSFNC